MAWSYAIRRKDGPTALCLTRQTVSDLIREKGFDPRIVQKGGYVLSAESGRKPDVILVASGSEVAVACEGKVLMEKEGKKVSVVSMPSVEVFKKQPESYQQSVIPKEGIPVAVVEAGVAHGWHSLTREPLLFIGMNGYGVSAPYQVLAEHFGFTGKSVAERVLSWLDGLSGVKNSNK
jgi:transketolase